MAKREASQIYAAAVAAGFSPDQAVTMTAIALAESSGDDSVLGDLGLQDAQWGPSVGLFQIRTLKAQTGSGALRDIQNLLGDPLKQAKAALQISQGGRDFSAWTVYRTGKWHDYLAQARAAAGGAASGLAGLLPNPLAGVGDAVLTGARSIAFQGVFVALGLGLLGLGVWRAVARRGGDDDERP